MVLLCLILQAFLLCSAPGAMMEAPAEMWFSDGVFLEILTEIMLLKSL